MTVEQQIRRLNQCVEGFVRCIHALPREVFLEKMDGWSPRDVLAHLIGWSRYTVEGCEEILRGEAPAYLSDWEEDFRNINAASVQKYRSKDRQELLHELRMSLQELEQYLKLLPQAGWEAGVRYCGHFISVQNSVEGLAEDYVHHTRQIERWRERARGGGAREQGSKGQGGREAGVTIDKGHPTTDEYTHPQLSAVGRPRRVDRGACCSRLVTRLHVAERGLSALGL